MLYLKLVLFMVMATLIFSTSTFLGAAIDDGVEAALLALMAAATFLVAQMPTQGQIGILLNIWVQLLAGAAAFYSAVNWIASEAENISHIAVPIFMLVTALVWFIAIVVASFHRIKYLRNMSQLERDAESE